MNNYLGVKSKRKLLLSFSCLFLFFCAGCGSNFDTTTLVFEKNGDIKQYVVEDFDTAVYSIDELNDFNNKQVNELNSKKGEVVVIIDKSEVVNNKTNIVMTYKENSSYYDLNSKVIYYGTANGAKNAGYGLSNKVKSIENEMTLTVDEWSDMTDEKVIIVSEYVNIKTPSKILYVSDGVTINDSDEATINGDSIRYIICK